MRRRASEVVSVRRADRPTGDGKATQRDFVRDQGPARQREAWPACAARTMVMASSNAAPELGQTSSGPPSSSQAVHGS